MCGSEGQSSIHRYCQLEIILVMVHGGLNFDISKYRDTCESMILILCGFVIL